MTSGSPSGAIQSQGLASGKRRRGRPIKQKTSWQSSKHAHTFTVHFLMVEYPSGQRALTVNQFGYAVRWFDSSFHHHFAKAASHGRSGLYDLVGKQSYFAEKTRELTPK